jgi:hypothetical protein
MSGTYEKESTFFPSHKYAEAKDFKLYCYHPIQIIILHHIKLIPGPELPVFSLNLLFNRYLAVTDSFCGWKENSLPLQNKGNKNQGSSENCVSRCMKCEWTHFPANISDLNPQDISERMEEQVVSHETKSYDVECIKICIHKWNLGIYIPAVWNSVVL